MDTFSAIVRTEKTSPTEEEGTESITYDHVCLTCSHVVSQHKVPAVVEYKIQLIANMSAV